MKSKDKKQIEEKNKMDKAKRLSKYYSNCVMSSANTIDAIHDLKLDLETVTYELLDGINSASSAEKMGEIKMMLMTQAQTLNVLFHRMLTRAMRSEFLPQLESLTNIALRAQNQSRKALMALAELNHPRRTTFIKQQNNAVNQQINNNTKGDNLEKNKISANELIGEVVDETLDFGTTREAVPIDTKA